MSYPLHVETSQEKTKEETCNGATDTCKVTGGRPSFSCAHTHTCAGRLAQPCRPNLIRVSIFTTSVDENRTAAAIYGCVFW